VSVGDERFSIELTREAEREIKAIPATEARMILQEIQARLSTDPFKQSKTRIKRLVGFTPPLYRLRVGDYRTYYRILIHQVVILTVLHKNASERWLKRRG